MYTRVRSAPTNMRAQPAQPACNRAWHGWRERGEEDLRSSHLDFALSVALNKQIQLALSRGRLEARFDIDALVCDAHIAKLDDRCNTARVHPHPPTPDTRARADHNRQPVLPRLPTRLLPSPTLSPTDPVPRGLLTLCPAAY